MPTRIPITFGVTIHIMVLFVARGANYSFLLYAVHPLQSDLKIWTMDLNNA